jgi:type II secretory pathway pseudopilin PulG
MRYCNASRAHRLIGRGRSRGGFALVEITASLALLGVALTLVAEVGVWVLQERVRLADHQAAQELAANVLEQARAHPWKDLTPAWAKEQRLPAAWTERGWRLEVRVASEKSRPDVKRVTAAIKYKSGTGPAPPPVELMGLFADRTAQAKGGKS